jgi:hypothetical protein
MKNAWLGMTLTVCVLVAGTSASATQRRKIGMTRARAIAAEKAPGHIESAELEKEHGKWVYSFDIRNDKGTITEVQVDAYSGAIASVEEENAQQEAEEKSKEPVHRRRGH